MIDVYYYQVIQSSLLQYIFRMKKSIITMIAVVIVAAINLNVYMDDAEANSYYTPTSTPCEIIINAGTFYESTIWDCDLWDELTGANNSGGNSSGGNSGGSEDSSEDDGYSAEVWDCEVDTGEEECFDPDGTYIDCDDVDPDDPDYTVRPVMEDGTTTFCNSLGMDSSCEEENDCGF